MLTGQTVTLHWDTQVTLGQPPAFQSVMMTKTRTWHRSQPQTTCPNQPRACLLSYLCLYWYNTASVFYREAGEKRNTNIDSCSFSAFNLNRFNFEHWKKIYSLENKKKTVFVEKTKYCRFYLLRKYQDDCKSNNGREKQNCLLWTRNPDAAKKDNQSKDWKLCLVPMMTGSRPMNIKVPGIQRTLPRYDNIQ